jgi:hypothetical protein
MPQRKPVSWKNKTLPRQYQSLLRILLEQEQHLCAFVCLFISVAVAATLILNPLVDSAARLTHAHPDRDFFALKLNKNSESSYSAKKLLMFMDTLPPHAKSTKGCE